MGKTKNKSKYLKYIVIGLAIVFLITGALLLLEVWERNRGRYPVSGTEDGVVTYQGKEYVLREGVESFLVLGLDKYDGATSSDSHESGVQTDLVMLFVFDNETQQCTAIHINRDTMASVNWLGIGGTKTDTFTTQIALAYNYVADDNEKVRCGNTRDSVEKLLGGININHYVSFTIDSVSVMNDLVGGVEVTVLDDFTGIDDTLVKGEKVNLTGEQALKYVRSRYGLEDSSNSTRMKRQQQYIEALYDKTISCIQADDTFIVNLVDTMDEYVVYDSSNQEMKAFANKFDQYDFLGIRELEGELKLGEQFMEFYPDEDSIWENVIELFYTPKGE